MFNSQEDLWSLVKHRIPGLLVNSKVRLVIIDSIAALFRVEYTRSEGIERYKALTEFGQELKRISQKYMVAVLCVNQVNSNSFSCCYANYKKLLEERHEPENPSSSFKIVLQSSTKLLKMICRHIGTILLQSGIIFQ